MQGQGFRVELGFWGKGFRYAIVTSTRRLLMTRKSCCLRALHTANNAGRTRLRRVAMWVQAVVATVVGLISRFLS